MMKLLLVSYTGVKHSNNHSPNIITYCLQYIYISPYMMDATPQEFCNILAIIDSGRRNCSAGGGAGGSVAEWCRL